MRPFRVILALAMLGACTRPHAGDIRPAIVGQPVEVRGEGMQWDGLVQAVADAVAAYRDAEHAPAPDAAPSARFLLVVGVTPDVGRGEHLNGRLVDRETGEVTCSVTLNVHDGDRSAAVAMLVRELFRRPQAGVTRCVA